MLLFLWNQLLFLSKQTLFVANKHKATQNDILKNT